MALVKGPNGSVYEIDDRVASGLVKDGKRGYEYVKDSKSETKSTASKSSSKK